MRPREAGFVHGLRVRVGNDKGVLLRCEPRAGDPYWRIRLQTGEWLQPRDFIVDGPGDEVDDCAQCGLPCYHRVGDLLCQRCDVAAFGPSTRPLETATTRDDIGPRRGLHRHRRPWHA
jgi:hypothetical protein